MRARRMPTPAMNPMPSVATTTKPEVAVGTNQDGWRDQAATAS